MPFQSIGFQQAFQYNKMHSEFGDKTHHIHHKNYFSNLIFNSIINNTKHKFITGLNFNFDSDNTANQINTVLDVWAEHDTFIQVIPGVATTVTF